MLKVKSARGTCVALGRYNCESIFAGTRNLSSFQVESLCGLGENVLLVGGKYRFH